MPHSIVMTMNSSPTDSGPVVRCDGKSEPATDSDLCAALVIDASGNIVAANRSTADVVGAGGKSLMGLPFVSLFAPKETTGEPADSADEWKSLCASALERWTVCTAQPQDAVPRKIRFRLERAFGGAGTYIAVLQPALRDR